MGRVNAKVIPQSVWDSLNEISVEEGDDLYFSLPKGDFRLVLANEESVTIPALTANIPQVNPSSGDILTLQTNASATAAYQWLFDGAEIDGKTAASLDTSGLGAGQVSVMVSDGMQEVTSGAVQLGATSTLKTTSNVPADIRLQQGSGTATYDISTWFAGGTPPFTIEAEDSAGRVELNGTDLSSLELEITLYGAPLDGEPVAVTVIDAKGDETTAAVDLYVEPVIELVGQDAQLVWENYEADGSFTIEVGGQVYESSFGADQNGPVNIIEPVAEGSTQEGETLTFTPDLWQADTAFGAVALSTQWLSGDGTVLSENDSYDVASGDSVNGVTLRRIAKQGTFPARYVDVVVIEKLNTSYTEAAVAFRPTSDQPGWTGPNYIANRNEAMGPELGLYRELAFFISFNVYTHDTRTFIGGLGGDGLLFQRGKLCLAFPMVDAEGNLITTERPNSSRDLLGADGNPRRVTFAGSLRHNVDDPANQYFRMWSHIEGLDGDEWYKDDDSRSDAHFVDLRSAVDNPGWAIGVNTRPDEFYKAAYSDIYGLALFAGGSETVPDFNDKAVRDTFFDTSTGTMNGRDLGIAALPYEDTLLIGKHGDDWNESSGGALSDGTENNLPPNYTDL